jgi:hypothetical protein
VPQNVLSPVCWTLFSPAESLPAVIAQLGERKTEDLKVSGSIPDCGKHFVGIHLFRQFDSRFSIFSPTFWNILAKITES